MRQIVTASSSAKIGDNGTLRIDLLGKNDDVLASDEVAYVIGERPTTQEVAKGTHLPEFDVHAVTPDSPMWNQLEWPDDISQVASHQIYSNQKLDIYYSSEYPDFAERFASLQRTNPGRAEHFKKKYELWTAVHSLLLYNSEKQAATKADASEPSSYQEDTENGEKETRAERCRIGTMAAIMAFEEVKKPDTSSDD